MRLINVNTFELEQFYGDKTPRYAILSHTWDGDNEVTFQEWERRADAAVRRKSGYAKIVGACRRAQADGLLYLWCDTNCIDKASSAELSEAINSMFAWYHDSHVCYAYLADVQAKTNTFAKSRWFSRGWTLQELLAPSTLVFFDCSWTVLGDKNQLAIVISNISKVHIGVLKDRSTLHDYSIAQRMSWAADRQTARPEDIAYCLLGIFNINMSLLYGEGIRAFIRLQQEIIKISDDQSILAWDLLHSGNQLWTGALAHSPGAFRFCGSIVRNGDTQWHPYFVTNLGLSIKLALIETSSEKIVLVGLNCAKELHREVPNSKSPGAIRLDRHFRIWIPLRHLKYDIYARTHYPSSKVFLQQSYPMMSRLSPTNLFLKIDVPQLFPTPTFARPVEILRQYSSCLPSGVLVLVASGKMASDGRILKEAYPLGNVSIIQLKGRCASTFSHQLISSGDTSIIFSVFWGEDGLPKEWLHTILFDPKLSVINAMAASKKWDCLFEVNGHTQVAKCCNNIAAMHSLHSKIKYSYKHPSGSHIKDEEPIVHVETTYLKDQFNKPELIVNVIFRTMPKLADT